MQLLDGKKVSQELYEKLRKDVEVLKTQHVHPKLKIILVGDNPASLSYIKQKTKAAAVIGIDSEVMHLKPEETTTESLISLVKKLNEDASVHGILVQLPLPGHIYAPEVLKAIFPQKDVDGFTAYNVGKIFLSKDFEDLPPCTPAGIIQLLEYYAVEIWGKHAVIVGASNTVGKPLAIMLLNRGATVTICNSKTPDLSVHTKMADIVVAAVGKPRLITAEMVKEGAVVVDVGTNRNSEGKLIGDTDFEGLKEKVSFISPVPRGVGPMTVAGLMENVIRAAKRLSLEKNNFKF